MKELRDRVAVITGAGSGIGAALSRACGERGMRVVVVDVEGEAAEQVAQSVRDGGAEAFACQVDIRQREEIERLADQVDERFGACHLLCNNAGVMVTRPLLELEERDWEWTLSVNLLGVVHAVSVFVPRRPGGFCPDGIGRLHDQQVCNRGVLGVPSEGTREPGRTHRSLGGVPGRGRDADCRK